jgi:hypothetical protein
MGNRVLQVPQAENSIHKRGNPDAVRPDHPGITGIPGEKSVRQDQFIPVSHPEEDIQKLGTYHGINANQHKNLPVILMF